MSYQSGVQKVGAGGCEDVRLTLAAMRVLRNSGGLSVGCPYTIVDPNTQGNLDVVEVQLFATAVNALGMNANVLTTHDNTPWSGYYDIDTDDVLEITDNLNNQVTGNTSILSFPFGVALVTYNTVSVDSIITYTAGTVSGNKISNNSNVTVISGNFNNNVVESDANVTSSGNTQRNHFEAQSNTTVNSGDFRENRVEGNATVISSTTGDVDGSTFGNLSSSTFSGPSNFDNSLVNTGANVVMTGGTVQNSIFQQLSNYTMSGGVLRESTVGQDADVAIISGDNYENVFGNSTVYRQVGTGYIRYSTIEGTTTWTNGNTNVSNVHSYASTIDTTGSTGVISNSTFSRVYSPNMQNVATLTITDCTIANYAQLSINGAARMYLYRTTITDGSRVLISAGARIDASYTNVNSYGYLQCNQSGGILTANYCDVSSQGYIRNITPNTHNVERCQVSSQSRISFEGASSGCRVYYSSAIGGSSIYFSGTSTNCYIYYSSVDGLGQMYTTDSVNARIYYCTASARSYVRSLNCPGTHYMYYCSATASGYVTMSGALGRMYAVHAASQSIVEKRGAQDSNLYYSTFTAYYYAYITKTTGTVSGLYGMGRRSYTVTDPVTIEPYSQGVAWQNF